MSQVACYIDGFNLYHAIRALGRPELKWLNLRTLARSYAAAEDQLVRVVYFTAILQWDQSKAQRHLQYTKASIEIAAPPGRRQYARELCSVANSHGEITEGRLRTCFLPNEVRDARGRVVARCPTKYSPARLARRSAAA